MKLSLVIRIALACYLLYHVYLETGIMTAIMGTCLVLDSEIIKAHLRKLSIYLKLRKL